VYFVAVVHGEKNGAIVGQSLCACVVSVGCGVTELENASVENNDTLVMVMLPDVRVPSKPIVLEQCGPILPQSIWFLQTAGIGRG
jgi:hypothetical protein